MFMRFNYRNPFRVLAELVCKIRCLSSNMCQFNIRSFLAQIGTIKAKLWMGGNQDVVEQKDMIGALLPQREEQKVTSMTSWS